MSEEASRFERLLPSIRSQFPQLEMLRSGDRRIYLDNAAGTLVPLGVVEAITEGATWMNPQPGRSWPAGPETERAHGAVRAQLGAFLNADERDKIFLSESTTASLYKLREALEPEWGAGDNVVVSDCDHFANISAWEWRARWEVRRAGMLPDGHLDLDSLAGKLDANTRVVALTMASNGLGTILRLDEAIPLVREKAPNAAVVIDAVHGAPHLPIDVAALDADAVAFSTYKLFGPNCGVLWVSAPLFARLSPFRVEPHTADQTLMEWGTLSNATVAGIGACLEYLRRTGERLEPGYMGQFRDLSRERRQFKIAMSAARAYEQSLSAQITAAMTEVAGIETLGVYDPVDTASRVPTFAFTVPGRDDFEVEKALWESARLQVAAGSHYSAAVLRGLGRKTAVRASFAHYNNAEEADAFIAALRDLA